MNKRLEKGNQAVPTRIARPRPSGYLLRSLQRKANSYHLRKVTYPDGIDVVFDTVGGKTYEESYSFLKPQGRLVSLLNKPDAALEEKFQVTAYYLFVSPNGKELQSIADFIEKNQVKPIRIQEMPLEKAAEAQEENRLGRSQGKIVLRIQ